MKCAGLAQGYWQRPEETEEKFHARTADTHEGPFMRTGDLGFMRYGELFIGGRVKDLIIIRGQNYYPQDVEWTAERSHRLLRPGCCAAFAVEVGLEERLVLVLEVRREFGPADEREVLEAIRERVAERHELQPTPSSSSRPARSTRLRAEKFSATPVAVSFSKGRWRRSPAGRCPRTAATKLA